MSIKLAQSKTLLALSVDFSTLVASPFKGPSIKDIRTKGGKGVCQMRTLLLILPVKGQNMRTQGGQGQKTVKFCGRPLWMAPNLTGYVRASLALSVSYLANLIITPYTEQYEP